MSEPSLTVRQAVLFFVAIGVIAALGYAAITLPAFAGVFIGKAAASFPLLVSAPLYVACVLLVLVLVGAVLVSLVFPFVRVFGKLGRGRGQGGGT